MMIIVTSDKGADAGLYDRCMSGFENRMVSIKLTPTYTCYLQLAGVTSKLA